jgi:hypothetical protein
MYKYWLVVAIAFGTLSCKQKAGQQTGNDTTHHIGIDTSKPSAPARQIDTVTQLVDQPDTLLIFKSPDGKFYEASAIDEGRETMRAARPDCLVDEFTGQHRKAAKTSIVAGTSKVYTGLKAFMKTLQKDSVMNKNPGITQSPTNNRVPEEARPVNLKKVFLYAIKREEDNDFHLILGDGQGSFFNVEASGLPAKGTTFYNKLFKARNQVKDFFGPFCMSNYRKFQPAIEVEVTGSLLFDIDHDAGSVGPVGLRSTTAWEIHPITNIVFK